MFDDVTLELSLKPFKKTDGEYIEGVVRKIFEDWRPLLKNRKRISIMLWCSDGSELLDYDGDVNAEFEWCKFVGTANLPPLLPGEPTETSLHERRQEYTENPPRFTYAVLKKIIATIKRIGGECYPRAEILVGETLDIGPEFAISSFKYERHNEICSGQTLCGLGFIDATATLHADKRKYAAYPDGIPEGTPFGTFLGQQAAKFLPDMDFDFLWLSNGLGFSSSPWDKTGKIFDGENYHADKLAPTKRRVFEFWQNFRKECPNIPLHTRGTNNSVGIDYASDGVPLYDIYRAGLGITAPPNSPWAAINDNFGLEIMGHMTRVCELPDSTFPFRYYLHDPWWINSPWYDRYDGAPSDIYLPMAISRIDAEGKIQTANKFNILSIDNSYGDMPECCVNEPIPHILKAEKDAPDEPSPLVWVYPMREYTTSEDEVTLAEMNIGDNFVCEAINCGLPLCCVTSTDSFIRHTPDIYEGRIIISPIPEGSAVLDRLAKLAASGVGVIIYGTEGGLASIDDELGFTKINSRGDPAALREALEKFGYSIRFIKKDEGAKVPTLAISYHDGALILSAYSQNTTTDTQLKFPLGAPILCGIDAEIRDGFATYRFGRCEHRECRIFVEQNSGVITCREAAPVSRRYRRFIKLGGLSDATVYLISERGCECSVSRLAGDYTPEFEADIEYITPEIIRLRGISGELNFLIGHAGGRRNNPILDFSSAL